MKRVIIIAGPNGAGKTTFAREFLPKEGLIVEFVNADLIASGLSPFAPDDALIHAGRLLAERLDYLAHRGKSFAFESTLSGRAYAKKIRAWREQGYRITVVFLRLSSPGLAIERVEARVEQGGHWVAPDVVRRRFRSGWSNFIEVYRDLADNWAVYDSSGDIPVLIEKGTNG